MNMESRQSTGDWARWEVEPVEWYEDGEGTNSWVCECGFMFQLTNDEDPISNGMNFCPGCGNRIVLVKEYEVVPIYENDES